MEGVYSINLRRGNYSLEFYAEGYTRTKVENYTVGLEEKLTLDVTLEVRMIIEDPAPDPEKPSKMKLRENKSNFVELWLMS